MPGCNFTASFRGQTGIYNSNRSRIASFTAFNWSTGSFPNFRWSASGSMLAKPCTFTAECFGSQRGFPISTSPLCPRSWEVRGATTARDRASFGFGTARTRTGRAFAARPKSTTETSPGCASVFTQCVFPSLSLFFRCQETVYVGGDGKGHVVSELYLGQKNVERIARFHAETSKDFLSSFETLSGHSCSEES